MLLLIFLRVPPFLNLRNDFSLFLRVCRNLPNSDCIVFIRDNNCLVVKAPPGMGACPSAVGRVESGTGTVGSLLILSSVVLPSVAPKVLLPKSLVVVIFLKEAGSIVCTDLGTIGPKPMVGNQTLLSVVAFPCPLDPV